MEKRRVSESVVETVHIVRPNHLNGAERLFGGILMQWMDEVAALVAKRHTHRNVVTLSVDNLRFFKGAYQKDVIVIVGRMTYTGRTSMEVEVDSFVEALDGERTHINHAYFTMVALDETGLRLCQNCLPRRKRRRQNGNGQENAKRRGLWKQASLPVNCAASGREALRFL